MMDTDEQIAALRAKLIPEPVTDLKEILDVALADAAYWRHKALALGAEVTARNAANIELGEMLLYADEKIRELRERIAQGAGTNPDFVPTEERNNASLRINNTPPAPGSPTLSGGDGPGVSIEMDRLEKLDMHNIAAEREECALIAETHPYPDYLLGATNDAEKIAAAFMAERIAASIRARKP